MGSEQGDHGICYSWVYSTVEAQSTMVASRPVELPERVSGTYSTFLKRFTLTHSSHPASFQRGVSHKTSDQTWQHMAIGKLYSYWMRNDRMSK